MAPSYANIFMDRLERGLIENAEVKPRIWWRYIDDIFIVWTEGEEKLRRFIVTLTTCMRRSNSPTNGRNMKLNF